MWFRRDLRLSDNPALAAASRGAGSDGEVVVLVCDDTRLRRPSGAARLAFLSGSLAALEESIGGDLVVRSGRPEDVVARSPARSTSTPCSWPKTSGPTGVRATPGSSRRSPVTTSSSAAWGRRPPCRRAGSST